MANRKSPHATLRYSALSLDGARFRVDRRLSVWRSSAHSPAQTHSTSWRVTRNSSARLAAPFFDLVAVRRKALSFDDRCQDERADQRKVLRVLRLLPVRSAQNHHVNVRQHHQVLASIACGPECIVATDLLDPPHVPILNVRAEEVPSLWTFTESVTYSAGMSGWPRQRPPRRYNSPNFKRSRERHNPLMPPDCKPVLSAYQATSPIPRGRNNSARAKSSTDWPLTVRSTPPSR